MSRAVFSIGERSRNRALWRTVLALVISVPIVAPGWASSSSRSPCPLAARTMPEVDGNPPNVVLIAVDTLRADHLGFLGYPRSVSPHLDALAADALVYERAIAAAPWTTPSFAGLFTGRHPAELGFAKEPILLPAEVPTLGQKLAERGYRTAGVISHFFLGRRFGFERGFDYWNEDAAGGHDKVSSPEVADQAIECLNVLAATEQPFFLFAHFFDPHYDYLGHEEFPFYAGYKGMVHSSQDNFEDLRKLARADKLSRADMRYLRDLYDSEIAFSDQHIGRVLDALKQRGLYEDSIIIFLADHGEMFAERRGRWIGHTQFLYDELVRVPLLIKLPQSRQKGRIPVAVSLVDVGATVFDLVDRKPPSVRSLLAISEGSGLPVFSQTRRWRQLDAVTHEGWKLILNRRNGGHELYDLQSDPGELEDRSDQEPERVAALQAMLDTWQVYNQRELAKLKGVEVPELTREEIERLRSLGYIQ